MSEITIHIKCSNADKATVKIETTATVLELKEKVNEQLNVLPAQQRLIYKGRVLKDDATIDSYGVENEHTVHMVKSGGGGAAAAPVSTTAPAATSPAPAVPSFALPPSAAPTSSSTQPQASNPFANPFAMGGLGGMGGMGGPGDINRMQHNTPPW